MDLYKQTDHYFYRKQLPNGDVLRTKVSMGSKPYSPGMFSTVLKQLGVTKEEFNAKI
jgi:hypothetical protein